MFSLLYHLAYSRGKIGEALLSMTLRLPVIETLMIREGLVLCPKGESQNFNEGHAKFVQSLTNEVETWEHSPMLSLSSLLWFFKDEERPLCPSWVPVRAAGVVLRSPVSLPSLCVVDRGCLSLAHR